MVVQYEVRDSTHMHMQVCIFAADNFWLDVYLLLYLVESNRRYRLLHVLHSHLFSAPRNVPKSHWHSNGIYTCSYQFSVYKYAFLLP